MTPEQEKKWREEAKTVAENSGAAKPYHDLITNGYLAARKAAQVEIDELKEKLRLRTNAEMNEQRMRIYQTNLSADLSVKLKDRDQEIERLKKFIEDQCGEPYENLTSKSEAKAMVELERRVVQDACEFQLKERDDLIKELRSLGTCDIDCDGVKCSKTCKKKSMIFEKARKLIGE